MDKTKQRELTHWLKQQRLPAKRWLRVSTLLGVMNGLAIIAQAWLLAILLHALIIDHLDRNQLLPYFMALLAIIVLKAVIAWGREKVGFMSGVIIRQTIRQQVLNHLQTLGPAWIKGKPAGSWATIILEQIENLHDFYARYLPQMALAATIPILILITIFPINWAAALILLLTAPLIPLFMAFVGMGAADANRRNFKALARLSGNFLDRLRGLETLRLFNQAEPEVKRLEKSANDLRLRTMDVLKLAFLSSAILEFFSSVSIAVVAVYFGFSYLGELNFGSYGLPITLFAGFLTLILAPEFYQPLRDLGTYYHAKAQAIGAAETLITFLATEKSSQPPGVRTLPPSEQLHIVAKQLIVLSPSGKPLAGPLDFTIPAGKQVALVGRSGAGKSSIINVLLGFLPYSGSLTINDIELSELNPEHWRQHLNWIGQNPYLPEQTIRENILLSTPTADSYTLQQVLQKAHVDEFLYRLPAGLDTQLGDNAISLSVGQAQRIAVARALLTQRPLLLLDEPTASLDALSEQLVMQALTQASLQQTTLFITHQLRELHDYQHIWVLDHGQIIEQGSFSDLQRHQGLFAKLLTHRGEEI